MGSRGALMMVMNPDEPPTDILWTQHDGHDLPLLLKKGLLKARPKWGNYDHLIHSILAANPRSFEVTAQMYVPDWAPIYVVPSMREIDLFVSDDDPYYKWTFAEFSKLSDKIMALIGNYCALKGADDREFQAMAKYNNKYWKTHPRPESKYHDGEDQ